MVVAYVAGVRMVLQGDDLRRVGHRIETVGGSACGEVGERPAERRASSAALASSSRTTTATAARAVSLLRVRAELTWVASEPARVACRVARPALVV